jgi:hypothetical protein
MIDPINAATTAQQAGALQPMQSHAKPFTPAAANPVEVKHFAQHMAPKAPEAVQKPAEAAVDAASANRSEIRERLSHVSKGIEDKLALHERTENELRQAAGENNLPKTLEVVGKLAKDVTLGHAFMHLGSAAAGAGVSSFQNLLRVSER